MVAFLPFVCAELELLEDRYERKNNIFEKKRRRRIQGRWRARGRNLRHDFACDMMGRDYGGSMANLLRLPS